MRAKHGRPNFDAIIENPAGAPPLDWHTDHLNGDWLWRFTRPHQTEPKRRRTIVGRNDPRRPLLSYITVACRGTGRYFDLDAVRGEVSEWTKGYADRFPVSDRAADTEGREPVERSMGSRVAADINGAGIKQQGAPPLDWHTDHLDGDWLWKLATAPYKGSHYATFPLALPRRLIAAMCPQRVCGECGWPSERIVKVTPSGFPSMHHAHNGGQSTIGGHPNGHRSQMGERQATTLGWTDCGHDAWRTGNVIDPFGGSGTTAVAAALEGRNATLIDLDRRNIELVDRRLQETVRVHNRTDDGDTITWTVTPATDTELDAIANGQMELFG
jgi:hypothetical protein